MEMRLFKWVVECLAQYSEYVLANRAQGFLGFFGLGKETTWGTPVAVSDYVN